MKNQEKLMAAKKLYQKLTWLYPKRYRERFGKELVQTFGDLYKEQKTRAWFTTGLDLLTSVPAQHLMELETNMQTSQRFSNIPYAVAGAILIAPFCLLILLAMAMQFFFHSRLNLSQHFSFHILAFFIIYLPLLAVLINVVALLKEMPGKKLGEIFSLKFWQQNIFSIIVAVLACLAVTFLLLHDAIPCFAHHVLRYGWQNFGHTISICKNA